MPTCQAVFEASDGARLTCDRTGRHIVHRDPATSERFVRVPGGAYIRPPHPGRRTARAEPPASAQQPQELIATSERGERILRAHNADQAWTALFGGNPTEQEQQEALDYVAADAAEREAVQRAQRILRRR